MSNHFQSILDEFSSRRLAENETETHLRKLFVPVFGGNEPLKVDWLVEGLLPKGFLVTLAGAPKCGKTSLATALAIAVASGTEFAGRRTTQGGVLWISGEESSFERKILLAGHPLVEESLPLYTCYEHLNVDDPADIASIESWASDIDASLLIVDPLLGSIGGRSLADSWNARRTLRLLKEFSGYFGVTTIVLHHRKRGEDNAARYRVADSDQLAATASMNMVMQVGNERHSPRRVSLCCRGRGTWANQTVDLLSSGPLDYTAAENRQAETADIEPKRPSPTRSWIINYLEEVGKATSTEICRLSGKRIGSLRNELTKMRREGLLRKVPNSDPFPTYELIKVVSDEIGAV